MAESKVILITGASRGIGYAISKFLLNEPAQHKLVVTSRTAKGLEDIKSLAPDRVEIAVGDICDPELSKQAVKLSEQRFGKLDSLILNHGTLGEVKRISKSDVSGWKETFDTNFFSCITMIQFALPALRKAHGRIVFTSSGAATNAYSTWGAYGSSKAAINHLALTLKSEEPSITSVSIKPGVVDSDMQKAIREVHHDLMDEKDQQKFTTAHTEGKLLRPEQPGNVIARLAVGAGGELNGQFLSWDDKALAAFQD